jgi:hypothetical protein
MAIHYGGKYNSIKEITGPSGFYTINCDGLPVTVHVDQQYDGGGWVCVLQNRKNTGGMSNLTYGDAVNTCNYRTGGSTNSAGPSVAPGDLTTIPNYNVWIGTKFWKYFGYRADASNITVVQYVSSTFGAPLNQTGAHTKRYRWRFGSFGSSYGFQSVSAVNDETGTGSPGMYSNHAVNGSNLSTFDQDQDIYGGYNCSTFYNNNPWWYNNCWSGNYFAGTGYQDAPYWDGSGVDYHNFGAVYIK